MLPEAERILVSTADVKSFRDATSHEAATLKLF